MAENDGISIGRFVEIDCQHCDAEVRKGPHGTFVVLRPKAAFRGATTEVVLTGFEVEQLVLALAAIK
jgi:hypothetical protein